MAQEQVHQVKHGDESAILGSNPEFEQDRTCRSRCRHGRLLEWKVVLNEADLE